MRNALGICTVLLCGAAGTATAVWLALNAPPQSATAPAAAALGSSTVAAGQQQAAARPAKQEHVVPSRRRPAPDDSSLDRGARHGRTPTMLTGAPRVAQQVGQQDNLPAPRQDLASENQKNSEAQVPVSQIIDVLREVIKDRNHAATNQAAAANPTPPAPIIVPQPTFITMPSPTASAALAAGPPAPTTPPGAASTPSPANDRRKPQVTAEGDNKFSLHLVDSDIGEVLQLLSRDSGITIMPSDTVKGSINASLINVDFDTALGAILKSKGLVARREGNIIYVGTADEFTKREVASGKINTRIFRPNYVTAAELQKLITPLLTQQVGTITVTSPAQAGIGSDSASAGGNSYANNDVILVRDYDSVLAQIEHVVHDVDVRPLQVAIEAMILSVKLNDTMDVGVAFEALKDNNHVRIVSGTPSSTLDSLIPGSGLKVGFLDSSLSVFVKALETVGDTNVIATPRILALNKMRAEILIGSQLGYVSTTVTETSTTQAVQFLEVGTQLRIRPFISSDGMVRMEIHPELSTGNVRTENGFTLPDKELTGVTTNVMARDGSTVIIGGLIREDLDNTSSQIPVLGNIPAIGALFRQKVEKTDRREIIVLITPRIVCDSDLNREGNQSAMEFHHRQAVFGEKMSPLSRVHLCKKYIYLARQAWGEGKQAKALRLVNMAIQVNPEDRSAIDLRADIAAGIPVGNHTGQAPFIPPGENESDQGEEIAPWVLDDLDPTTPKPGVRQGASQSVPAKRADGQRTGGP